MKKTFVLLATAAAVLVPATASHAAADEAVYVYISDNGNCTSDFIEVAQAGDSAVCVRRVTVTPPNVRPTTSGCSYGETAYLVLNRYGVCVS